MAELDSTLFGVSIAGAVLVLIRLFPLLMGAINARAFDTYIAKLLAEGNRDRALKLCGAAPNSSYVCVVRAMLEKSRERSAKEGFSFVHSSIEDAHRRAHDEQLARVRRFGWLGSGGALVTVVAVALASRNGLIPPPLAFGPAGVALLLWFAATRKVRAFLRASDRAREKLLPELVSYVMDRREPGA